MRVATLNLNRRLFSRREDIAAWCAAWGVEVLLLQECWPQTASYSAGPPLAGLRWIGGDGELGAYAVGEEATSVRHDAHHLEVRVGGRSLHDVYLDANRARAREKQLLQVTDRLGVAPALVAGDFNLAPAPEDGLYGGQASTYTKAYVSLPDTDHPLTA